MPRTANVDIQELARTVTATHGIETLGAAIAIVEVLVGQVAQDPELHNADTCQFTDDGEQELHAAVAAINDEDLYSTNAAVVLEALTDTTIAAREKLADRDALIRAALRTDVARAKIAAAAGVTEARLYQIRDGR